MGFIWSAVKPTAKQIAQLARILLPNYGLANLTSLILTVVHYRRTDGCVMIDRRSGEWSWHSVGTQLTSATLHRITISFPADYRRTAALARAHLYKQIERLTET